MRSPTVVTLALAALACVLACSGKNTSHPEHRHSQKDQEQIDNICGTEQMDWQTPFAAESDVLERVRSGTDTAAGRGILTLLSSDARSCDSKMYRVCRLCMELPDTGKCAQIQGGAMEYCLEKGAGVSDTPGEDASEAPEAAPAEAAPAE